MEQVLKGMNKVIIDGKPGANGVVPYLPLPELQQRSREQAAGRAGAAVAARRRAGSRAMNSRVTVGIVAGVVVVLFLLLNALFTVHQTQQALVLQFGNPVDIVQDPGLHLKVPFVQQVEYFDKRVLDFDAPSVELVLGDQKRLVVDAFARYRITDPLRSASRSAARRRSAAGWSRSCSPACAACWARRRCSPSCRSDRTQLMNRIKSEANKSLAGFGVELVDVRIKRADLPPENSQAIFQRMQTERQREAKELRAQGAEVGQRIRARADRERRVLIAEAAAGVARSCAARATPRRSGSSPTRSARIPSSSTSTARCRPIANALGDGTHQPRALAGQRVLPLLQRPAVGRRRRGRRAGPGAQPAQPAAPAPAPRPP